MTRDCPACDIAEELLERTGVAMISGDVETFVACFAVPLVMETFDEKLLLQSRADVEHTFLAVRDFRQRNGVCDSVRENIAAEFLDADTIAATHVSQMLKHGNELFGQPYAVYSIIRRFKDEWLINFCQYAVDDLPQFNAALAVHKQKDAAETAAPLSN